MTPDEILAKVGEARAICDAATPGPWGVCGSGDIYRITGDERAAGHKCGINVLQCIEEATWNPDDSEFAAAARTGWPEALDIIEQLVARMQELEASDQDDIDPPQSGSGLFKATTQPSLDEIRALAIRTLQAPASKVEAVLAAAFLDARRQIERAPEPPKLTPEQAASCYVNIYRCPGRNANGNIVRCHPKHEPGKYDVSLGLVILTALGDPLPFDEAKQFAKSVQYFVEVAIRYDREGTHEQKASSPRDIDALREEDIA